MLSKAYEGPPGEGLGFPGKGGVERGHGRGNVRQESMVVVNHADELLQGLHSGGHRKSMNRSNLLLQGEDTLGRYIMAQEIDLLGHEDTFVMVENKTSGAETFEDQMKVTAVLFRSGGEDEDVIDVGGAEGEIT